MADILRCHLHDYPHELITKQARVLHALQLCRTAPLGGHAERCDLCGHKRVAYNSCRNRHCPKCQFLAKDKWVEKQLANLLPVPHFHIVFTMPTEMADLALQNNAVVYGILFQAAAETLQTIARDPKHLGAQIGILAVLHTWGQNLHFHPHIHCVVPGGGLSPDGCLWVASRENYFLPVQVLSALYRRLFLEYLTRAHEQGRLHFCSRLAHLIHAPLFEKYLDAVRWIPWVVYAKAPFGGPEQVIAYIGRYTHRTAISNDRLLSLENGVVAFRWKDYRQGNEYKTMTLHAHDFIQRFLLHVLPAGFVRIRSYGLLATRNRPTKLAKCREILQAPKVELPATDWKTRYEKLTGTAIDLCPACKKGKMLIEERLPSAWERLPDSPMGVYDPRILVSRLLAICMGRRPEATTELATA